MLNTKKTNKANVKPRFLSGKNKFVKFIMLITASFLMHAATAQDASTRTPKFTPEQKAERMTVHLKQQLSLSDDQTGKVKAVYLEHLQKMESGSGKRKDAHAELEGNLSKVLTADQLTTFKTIESERKNQMKARRNQQIQSSPADQDSKQNNSQPIEQK
ncbi:MAG: hypothetical protein ABI855_18060 [Bacteroidota bacterium]